MSQDFSPVIWPEEKVPEQAANCQKCELHCQRSRIIWGEGNPKAPILVLLDNPGAREDNQVQNLSVAPDRPFNVQFLKPAFR